MQRATTTPRKARAAGLVLLLAALGLALLPGPGPGPATPVSGGEAAQAVRSEPVPGPGLAQHPGGLPGDARTPGLAPVPAPAAGAHDGAPAAADPGARPDGAIVRGGSPLTLDHPLMVEARGVQARHTRDLLRHPLVVGTGLGVDSLGRVALIVFVRRPAADLPRQVEGLPVEVHVSGELLASKGKPGPKPAPVDPTARFARPTPIGVSTGHPSITAGTIGCRVLRVGGDLFALSNNHVYANENSAVLGDAVLQPGPYDGGTSPDDDLGELDDFEPIVFTPLIDGGANEIDAAIARTTALDLGHSTPSDGYGRPRSTVETAAIGLRVSKYGRTTGLTHGRVYALNASVNIGYEGGTAGFVGQIVITPGSFSAGGDSGALVVGRAGSAARRPVGLLFAGSPSVTIANPIGLVLERFDVTVDGD